METLETALDGNGNQVVVEIEEIGDIIYLGKDFPDEYSGSKYTRKMNGLPCRYMIMM